MIPLELDFGPTALMLTPLVLAIGWLSLLVLALRLLGPILGKMLEAQFKQFEARNPRWKGSKGVELLHDIGLSVVEAVAALPAPERVADADWDDIRMRTALVDLAGRVAARGIAATTQMLRRTVEDALTAFKQGERTQGL